MRDEDANTFQSLQSKTGKNMGGRMLCQKPSAGPNNLGEYPRRAPRRAIRGRSLAHSPQVLGTDKRDRRSTPYTTVMRSLSLENMKEKGLPDFVPQQLRTLQRAKNP